MIPYGHHDISQADIDAVVRVLRSDFLTQGSEVPRFEQLVADACRARHAVAVNSATSALHVACLALGLGPGDTLWTVPNTFVASANCALYCGARVDFVDIDATTWTMSVASLREKLVRAKADGALPKVVVPVHFAGLPTEQEAIWNLGREYGFRVLEDASHSIGATRHGEPVGSCRWADIVVFSFHPVKIITSGEGGMALTNDAGLAERMTELRSHGVTRSVSRFSTSGPMAGPWHYEQQHLGFNYRMTDIHAALGASQMSRLGNVVERRNALAERYTNHLRSLPLGLPAVDAEVRSAFHLYVVRLRRQADVARRPQLFSELRARGIGVNVHYEPVHLQPYYRSLGFGASQFPESEAYSASAITLPLYPTLKEQEQDHVISVVGQLLSNG